MPERADVFQMRLGLGLHGLGHGVQNIGCLVNPAPLDPGLAVNFMERGPEPHGTIANRKLGRSLQAPAFQIQEQLAPALCAFAKAVDQTQNILVAPLIRPDDHQHALAILVHTRREVDAVCPEIHIAPRRKVALGPAFIIVPPIRLQPGDGRGRQSRRVRPQQGREGFGEIAGRDALEI